MITEKELKDRCTPEFIKWMCELAEGFEVTDHPIPMVQYSIILKYIDKFKDSMNFPLLIHRAVEGWNNLKTNKFVHLYSKGVSLLTRKEDCCLTTFDYLEYQPENLTQLECALLNCLLEIFEEE